MTLETTKQSLEKWHEMVQAGNLSDLNDLLADEVVFAHQLLTNLMKESRLFSSFLPM